MTTLEATPEQVVDFLTQGYKMKVYLAAPFFTPAQLASVEAVEDALRPTVDLYSPRQDGIVLKDLPYAERATAAKKVFQTNIDRLEWCGAVVAIIDDRDAGTYFEIGYAHARRKPIITYTACNYGLNVMLQESVLAHVARLPDLAYLFQKGLPDEICALFRNFHHDVT